ncbi:cell division protein FtsQ/DivIB [Gorillibacterium timonense]|uniref:cell division protein FtsQ/DivIB n=1 Tax=Gorillibacterium timonense TaxID=1689269 RepID=UPI00071CA5BF|nr:FtsQ-type POTRA domain-containing protein [Gorillibacterium timonense]
MPKDQTVPALKAGRPKKRGSRRLILVLLFFFLILFAYLFFQSPLGKISEIRITGNEIAELSQLGQASGVKTGDSFFLVKVEDVKKHLLTVKAVESVKVTKTFPGLLNIEVKEFPRAAYQLGKDGRPEVVLADGNSYGLKDKAFPSDRPILTGWEQGKAEWKELARVLAAIPEEQLSDISEIKPYPNVFSDRIKLYTRSRFEVVTRISLLEEKIPKLSYYTSEFKRKNGTTGILTLLEQDRGIPFPQASSSLDP